MKLPVVLMFMAMVSGAAVAQAAPAQDQNKDKPAQTAKAENAVGSTVQPSAVYETAVGGIEKQFVSLAEAMPADKYNYAPTQGEFKGVRTFGEQVKHVAQANMMFYSIVLGEKPAMGEASKLDNVKSKEQIVELLKKSFELGHRAAQSLNSQNAFQTVELKMMGNPARIGVMTLAVAHAFDHYGQIVEYGRMNGIVPPASRK